MPSRRWPIWCSPISRAPKKVADLFAGCGSFALRLAKKAEVHAVEGDAAAVAALDRAMRQASGLRRVTTERRDLFRRPLTFKELKAFDGARLRSAARRRRGPVEADRPLRHSLCRRRLLQPRHAGARPRDPRRRRLQREERDTDRPVPLVAACRGRRLAGEAEEEALRRRDRRLVLRVDCAYFERQPYQFTHGECNACCSARHHGVAFRRR